MSELLLLVSPQMCSTIKNAEESLSAIVQRVRNILQL